MATAQAFLTRFQNQRDTAKRIADLRKERLQKWESTQFNPANAIASAISAYIASGGNPLMAAGAAITSKRGTDFKPIESIAGGATQGMAGEALAADLGPALQSGNPLQALQNLKPETIMKGTDYIQSLDQGKSGTALQSVKSTAAALLKRDEAKSLQTLKATKTATDKEKEKREKESAKTKESKDFVEAVSMADRFKEKGRLIINSVKNNPRYNSDPEQILEAVKQVKAEFENSIPEVLLRITKGRKLSNADYMKIRKELQEALKQFDVSLTDIL